MEEKRDQEEELKHFCKLCNKKYPSGKSLGGHMRSHVIANRKSKLIPSPPSKKALSFNDVDDHDVDDDDHDVDVEDDEDDVRENGNGKNYGYGLRENPKKTWRLVDSISHNNKQQLLQHHSFQQQERVCKQCGKGFHSLKALCGHMSSHSEKERNFKEEDDEEDDNSWSSDSKDQLMLAMESHSDNNNNNKSNSKRQTRSSLTRYRSLTTTVDSLSPPTATTGSGYGVGIGGVGGGGGGGSSSNHSEIDQHEQEEVAMCLMMLSRDYSGHNKSCFNFTAESSDNNSVILEGGSSTNHVGILRIKDSHKKMIKQVVVAEEEINVDNDNDKNDTKNNQDIMDNSDSGYFENGAKELESDDSVDGFVRNYGFKKPKVEFGGSRVLADSSSFYGDNGDDSRKRRIRGELVGNFSRFDSPESDENSSKKMIVKQDYHGYTTNNNLSIKKGSKYECCMCNKTFKTHQALGGHIISHRKNGDSSLDTTRLINISAKQNLVVAPTTPKVVGTSKSKKAKGHKCPYCPKVFKSGQALGGHKRSHMMGGGSSRGIVHLNLEGKSKIERPIPPPPPTPLSLEFDQQRQQAPLIDLNLPAPMEEEGNSQFVAW